MRNSWGALEKAELFDMLVIIAHRAVEVGVPARGALVVGRHLSKFGFCVFVFPLVLDRGLSLAFGLGLH